ncbi:VWA domain-containing protein [Fluviicola taffensis]|uniref:von Willebrand factor type A n=1 Tax=Fluviicola taffensis (strain DSM 16823 / NCIMB 13979 / RW262) TaxID=755732 RepID=F2IJP3_FLUTR|nr:VWA domain-containing protein [Fluviicola taffensis]AEA43933.1 von Willebrand factor type A [Fluviicola taffensis DSM 16823]
MTKKTTTYQRLMSLLLISEGGWWLLVLMAYLFIPFNSWNVKLLFPEMLSLWMLIPVFAGLSWIHWNWKAKIYENYSGYGNTRMLWVTFEPLKAFLHYFLLRSTYFFIILAMAQPVAGSRKVNGSKRVLDLVICLDISNSMNTQDMGGNDVSRLTAAKQAIGELLNQLKGERIAVVIFANDAYTQLPLTMDYGAAKLFIPDIETSMISDQGTNVGRALEIAQEQFKDTESGKAILVITDGEDHEALWKEQIAELKKKNVELTYLGLGSSKGGLIPNNPYDISEGYKRESGQAVVSRIDKSGLERMASESGSILVTSDSPFPNIYDIATNYKNTKNKQVMKVEFNVDKNYFYVPTILALLCMICYFFLPILIRSNKS